MELKNKKINFLGDSITCGSGTTCPEARFSNLIAEQTGAVCRNYGIGGTRISRQKKPSADPNWDKYFGSRVEAMDPDADAIVVFGGTNDYGHGDAPFGTMQDRTPDTFYGALHCLCISLINKYPRANFLFITPLHRLGEDNPLCGGNRDFPTGTLADYVKIIREVMEYYSIPVLDLFKEGKIQPNVPSLCEIYTVDGLHPSDEGHIYLAHRIIKKLESL